MALPMIGAPRALMVWSRCPVAAFPLLSVYLGLENGRSIEAAAHGATVAAVPLPSQVAPMAAVDTLPWLEPLAGIFTPGDHSVAVIDRHAARLFRGAPRMLVEFAIVRDQRHRKPTVGACSGPAGCCPTEERLSEHAGRLAKLLLRAHHRRAFDQLLLIAPRELWYTAEGACTAICGGASPVSWTSTSWTHSRWRSPVRSLSMPLAPSAVGCTSQTALPAPAAIKLAPDTNTLALV